MFLLQEGDRLTYEKMKNWFIRRISHLQNEARKQFEKKKSNNSKELEVKWEEGNNGDDDANSNGNGEQGQQEQMSSGDSSSYDNNNNNNSSSNNSYYRNSYGAHVVRKERPRQVVYSRNSDFLIEFLAFSLSIISVLSA
jgi:hypothetical protein